MFANELLPLIPIAYVLYIHRQTFTKDQTPLMKKSRAVVKEVAEHRESFLQSSSSKSKISISAAFVQNPRQKAQSEKTVLTSSQGKNSPVLTCSDSHSINSKRNEG